MIRYLLGRVAQSVVVLLVATLVLFVCFFVLPGDPFSTIGGSAKAREPAVRAQLQQRYGLDRPLYVQYVRYMGGLARGDLGESFRLRQPVNQILLGKAANTARLAGAAFGMLMLMGVAAGILAGVARKPYWDVAVLLTTTLLLGVPVFVLGLLLQQVLAINLGVLPVGGSVGTSSLVLPALTLAAAEGAVVTRLMRGSIREVIGSDYVRAAQAKGLSPARVALGHVLPNALLPVITYAGIALGTLLGGALVVEVIFDWDGLGRAAVVAVQRQDSPVILGVTVMAVTVFVVVNLVVDLLYAAVDPRVRLRGAGL